MMRALLAGNGIPPMCIEAGAYALLYIFYNFLVFKLHGIESIAGSHVQL